LGDFVTAHLKLAAIGAHPRRRERINKEGMMSSFPRCAELIRNETWKNYSRHRGRTVVDLVSFRALDTFESRTYQGEVQQKIGQIVRRSFAQGRSHLLFSRTFIWAA
jgi:hypothetical protein